MKRMNAFIAIGLMLFAMFFGAGNLIFPPSLGQAAGTNILPAIIGFLVTGCGLPLLAVVTVCYSGKDFQDIASRVSPWYGIFLVAAVSLTIGPFFAIPRTCSTAFEMALAPVFGNDAGFMPLFLFSIVYFAISLWLAITPSKLVNSIGHVLTPAILILLAALFVAYTVAPFGAWQEPDAAHQVGAAESFVVGILEGYNTMDGLAGLLFGILVVNAVRDLGISAQKTIAKATFISGIVACGCMSVIYLFLSFIGASSVEALGRLPNGALILVGTMDYYFGSIGSLLLGVLVLLACLTTSIGLIASISALFAKMFPKISFKAYAIGFTLFSTGVANFGLTTIISAAIPVLVFVYPLTIALILLTFMNDLFDGDPIVHRMATAFTFVPAVSDGMHVLGVSPTWWHGVMSAMPLAEYGLTWIPFFVVGLAIGWGIHLMKGNKSEQ